MRRQTSDEALQAILHEQIAQPSNDMNWYLVAAGIVSSSENIANIAQALCPAAL
jgi:hypothetical protein